MRAHTEIWSLLYQLVDFVDTVVSFVSVCLIQLSSGLDVQNKGYGHAGFVWPIGIGSARAVAPEIAGVLWWIGHTPVFE